MVLKDILITGSNSVEWRRFLIENVFETNYVDCEEYDSGNNKIIQLCDLNRLHFDFDYFSRKCNEIKRNDNLKAIIMIENLNPRPETLMDDISTLGKVFDSDYLKKHLYVLFTFSNKPIGLVELRESVIKFDSFFQFINCNREKFLNDRVWILNDDNIISLKRLPFFKIETLSKKRPSSSEIQHKTKISKPQISDSFNDITNYVEINEKKNSTNQIHNNNQNNIINKQSQNKRYNNNSNSKNNLIFITGSNRVEWRRFLIENVFETNYVDCEEYDSGNHRFVQLCDLNRLNFDFDYFSRKCNEIERNDKLKAIIMIENLNPRPETLMDDISTLTKVFDLEYLKKHLYVLFTFTNKPLSLDELRKGVLKFDSFFQYFNCNDREKFINDRVWILDNDQINKLKQLQFLNLSRKRSASYSGRSSSDLLNLRHQNNNFKISSNTVISTKNDLFLITGSNRVNSGRSNNQMNLNLSTGSLSSRNNNLVRETQDPNDPVSTTNDLFSQKTNHSNFNTMGDKNYELIKEINDLKKENDEIKNVLNDLKKENTEIKNVLNDLKICYQCSICMKHKQLISNGMNIGNRNESRSILNNHSPIIKNKTLNNTVLLPQRKYYNK